MPHLNHRVTARLYHRGITLAAVLTANSVSSAVAAVPSKLAEATLKAALSYLAGSSANISVGALALAQGLIMGKIKIVLVVLTAAALAVTGVGWAEYQLNGGQVPKERTEAKPQAQTKKPDKHDVASTLGSKEQPRVDAYGDPLPEGAVARLGARQFRHEDMVTLAHTRDGKSLVGLTSSGILAWDAATGIEQLRHRVATIGVNQAMAISPDGKSVAVAGHGSGITLWALQSGQNIRTLPLPDGDRMEQRPLRLSFTPDGKLLAASYTEAGRSLVFDVVMGAIRIKLGGKDDYCCFSLTLSPDGKTMAAAVCDPAGPLNTAKHEVHLLETSTGKLIRVLHKSHQGGIGSLPLAFSPNGKSLAFSVNERIFVYETTTGKAQASFDSRSFPSDLIFTPDGTRLAWYAYSGHVGVWDLATEKIVHALDSRFGHGSSLAISPDGKTVALGGGEANLRLWEMATGKEQFTEYQGHDSCIVDQIFSPDGKTLVTTGHRQTFLWDTSTWKISGALPWGAQRVSFSPDGKRLAAIEALPGRPYSLTIRVLDMASGKDVNRITDSKINHIQSAIYSSDGRTIYTLDWRPKDAPDKGFIRHWNADTGRQTERIPIPIAFSTLAPNGKTVFGAFAHRAGGNVMMFDLGADRKRLIGPANGELSYRPALSPDARHLAFAFAKRKGTWWENVKDTRVCEVATGKEILFLKGHQSDNVIFAWSPDGRILATGTARAGFEGPAPEQTIRLWDTATGREIKTYDGINADAAVLTFAPNGKTLVAGLRDGTLLVFDVSKFDPRPQSAPPLSDDDLEAYWSDLAGDDAVRANKSAWRLADAGVKAVPFCVSD
jgi:WD40 repeat protein